MGVDIDGGSSDRIERTDQIKSFQRTEPKDHLVSRDDDECLQSYNTIEPRVIVTEVIFSPVTRIPKKKPCYRRRTARRAASVKILNSAEQVA